MTTCPACGKEFRNGTTVLLLDPAAGSSGVRKRVCSSCANRALVVVAPRIAPEVVEKVERNPKFDLILNQLRVLAHGAKTSAGLGGVDAVHFGGLTEGYEGAIEVVKRAMEQDQ